MGRRGDEDGIHAIPLGKAHRLPDQIFRDNLYTTVDLVPRPRPLGPSHIRFKANDLASTGSQHLNRQLSHQPETDDGDRFAKPHLALADALEGDGADGGAGGVREADAVRDFDDEVPGNGVVFGVVGESGTAAGDAVADLEVAAVASRLDDDAGAGIAERDGLVEFGLHLLERGEDAFGLHLADDLPDLVRHLEGLADEALLGEFGEHALGAGAHEAGGGPDDRAAGLAQGRGDIREPHLTGLERLEDLFHKKV